MTTTDTFHTRTPRTARTESPRRAGEAGANHVGAEREPITLHALPESGGDSEVRALLQSALSGDDPGYEVPARLPPLGATLGTGGGGAPGPAAAASHALPELLDGRYEVLEALSLLGHTPVYRVRHAHLGKELALKLLGAPRAEDGVDRARFVRVARSLTRLEHPNLVRVTDFGVDAEHGAYLVMELVEGETLREELRARRHLPLHRAVHVTLCLADALSYVHSQGLVHGSVAAENVLACPVGPHTTRHEVRLADYGSAAVRHPETGPRPEADLLGLGALLYELVTGRRPFPASVSSLEGTVLPEEPLRPSLFVEEPLPHSMEAFLLRVLAPDPSARPQSMAQLMFELRALAEALELPVSRGGRVEPAPEEPVEAGASLTVRHSVYPIFRLDRFCEVSEANAAFVEFLETTEEALSGTPLRETRLYEHFPEAVSDLARQIQLHPGAPFQRMILFEAGGERTIPLLLSVAPERDPDARAATCYTGLIIPLLPTL